MSFIIIILFTLHSQDNSAMKTNNLQQNNDRRTISDYSTISSSSSSTSSGSSEGGVDEALSFDWVHIVICILINYIVLYFFIISAIKNIFIFYFFCLGMFETF